MALLARILTACLRRPRSPPPVERARASSPAPSGPPLPSPPAVHPDPDSPLPSPWSPVGTAAELDAWVSAAGLLVNAAGPVDDDASGSSAELQRQESALSLTTSTPTVATNRVSSTSYELRLGLFGDGRSMAAIDHIISLLDQASPEPLPPHTDTAQPSEAT